jgi:hypothetical protein
MSRQNWHATTAARLLPSVVSLALVAVIALVVPASAASVNGNNGGKDIVSTTENYITTFYPIWFTHTQFQVAPHNELIGTDTISPVYQRVVAINDDTLYASSPIDVSGGKVIVSVPATSAGYSVLLLDPYGNVYPSGIPSKAAGVNTPTTVYALVGADYPGSVPNAITVRLPLQFMVLIFRVLPVLQYDQNGSLLPRVPRRERRTARREQP